MSAERLATAVLLPFRNASATIVAAVRSVATEPHVVVVAVDDHSEDGGAALLRREVPCARVLLSRGRGIVAALETGIAATDAPWIARMDADDVSLPGRIAKARALLRAHPELGAVGTQVRVAPANRHPGLERYVDWQNRVLSADEHRAERFVEAPVCHPSVVLRRTALDAVGGYRDVPWAEDYDLWLRLIEGGWQLRKVPEILFEWRHREGRLTFRDPRYSPEAFRALKANFLARVLDERLLAIWGAGATGKRLARALEACGRRAALFVDIDPKKIGGEARGAPIIKAGDLPENAFVVVAVGAQGARDVVRSSLLSSGRCEEVDFLLAS